MASNVWPVDAVGGVPEYSARERRQVGTPLVAGATAARPLGARSGVRPGTPTTTVTATSTVWTVKPHSGLIDAQSAAEAGPYFYATDANVTGAVTAANATNPRRDLIWARIDDPAEADGSSVPAVVFGYTAGTAAASPATPATPARSIALATINVPVAGGGSPTVTWTAPYCAAAGGTIPVRSQAERDAISFGTAEYPVYVDRLDAGAIERSVASGTWTTVSFSAASGTWNLPGTVSVATNVHTLFSATTVVETPTPGKLTNSGGAITVTDAGVYEVDVTVRWPGTSNPQLKRLITVTANCPSINSAGVLASGVALSAGSVAPTATLDFTQRFRSRRFTLAAGDVIRVFLAQDTAGPLVVGAGLNDSLGFGSLGVYRVA